MAVRLVVLAEATSGREGAASSAIHLSDQLGFALGTGVAGEAVALGEVVGWVEADSLLIGAGITGVAALAGLVLSQRVPARLRGDPVPSPADRRQD